MERNEAIDVIKRNYPHVTESGSQFETALRLLIPELKEDEDERIRKKLIDYFKGFFEGNEDTYKVGGGVTWKGLDVKKVLAWLEKKGEQKPAWSEEDETKLNELIRLMEQLRSKYVSESHCYPSWGKLDDWLKSLKDRYTWKPSEEQMSALNDVISSRDIKYDVLSELWKDLKKLKGYSYESIWM